MLPSIDETRHGRSHQGVSCGYVSLYWTAMSSEIPLSRTRPRTSSAPWQDQQSLLSDCSKFNQFPYFLEHNTCPTNHAWTRQRTLLSPISFANLHKSKQRGRHQTRPSTLCQRFQIQHKASLDGQSS